MHMADALLSPPVGATMWVATAGTIAYASRKVRAQLDDRKVPLMGVLGAFIFAAQMINFTIPGTGSSGHLGGGMILAILLGPHAALITLASVLTVQALFFADGGLLALGCNIFNLGFFPCFVAYPLLYRKIAGPAPSRERIVAASIVAAVVGLQLGALAVVAQTALSGISALPFGTFLLMMQPIHLAIGVVEGLVTAAVVTFVWQAQPELVGSAASVPPARMVAKKVLIAFAVATFVVGGMLSWFASSQPDGLEWAISRTTGGEEPVAPPGGIHDALEAVQSGGTLLPDYAFREDHAAPAESVSVIDVGSSVSGIVGGSLTLVMTAVAGLLIRRRSKST